MHLSPRLRPLRQSNSGQVGLTRIIIIIIKIYAFSTMFVFLFLFTVLHMAQASSAAMTVLGIDLVLTGDSTGGSTPDRAHDWGSPPYGRPPRVPGYSHWLYDVMSFYYCCLWSDHCHIYFKHRPSSGCCNYQPPQAGEPYKRQKHTI